MREFTERASYPQAVDPGPSQGWEIWNLSSPDVVDYSGQTSAVMLYQAEDLYYANAGTCPECGGAMVRCGTCFSCQGCGYGSCGG